MAAKKSSAGAVDTLASIAGEIKDASVRFLSDAKDAIKTVAPALWKMVKAKVIGDAVAMVIVVGVVVMVVWRFWADNPIVVSVALLAAAFPLAGAVKRMIASDFFTLLEVLGLAKKKEG